MGNFPVRLIKEIQKYVQGETLYIPKTKSSYKKWDTCTGSRKLINQLNNFQKGRTIAQLSNEHFLSIDSIKKIVYSR